MLAYLSKKCNHIRVIWPVKSQKTRAAALSAAEARHSANGARLFAHGAAFCVHSHERAGGEQRRHADDRRKRLRRKDGRPPPARPRPRATARAQNPAAAMPDSQSAAGLNAAAGTRLPQHRASTLFPACPGSSRNAVSSSAQSPSAACRPVRPPAAAPHRNIEHRNTNDGVRARASKTGNMPFVHTSPPFGSHRTAYSRSRVC